MLGGHGGINGGANMFPELYVDLYHAAVARDMETVSRLQPLVMQISSSIYTVGQHGSSYLKGLKCALSLLGVCDDFVAAPFHRLPYKRKQFHTFLLQTSSTLGQNDNSHATHMTYIRH
jgi:2-dehydro-3-deoxy-D-pentonate aldolase